MKIVILGYGFINWGGGRDFLLSCINALTIQNQMQPLEMFMVIPGKLALPETEMKAVVEWVNTVGKSVKIFFDNNNDVQELIYWLKQYKIDVVIPTMFSLGKNFPFPWVGYIYDFQHEYYPNFFTEDDIKVRHRGFGRMVSEAKAVIVNSKAVKEDVYKYYPTASCEVFNLPFSPVPEMSWFEEQGDVVKKYDITGKYFIICNQFWIHKGHSTAFEALAILKEKINSEATIVCTGNTSDYRSPGYMEMLKAKISTWGLENNVYILGHISKTDQIQLMRRAEAVIQPTLFEGGPGGGAVREAVALGIPAIVSDISVNREIEEDKVIFFMAGSAADLAEKMAYVLKLNIVRSDKSILLNRGKAYSAAKGERLLEAISYVTKVK